MYNADSVCNDSSHKIPLFHKCISSSLSLNSDGIIICCQTILFLIFVINIGDDTINWEIFLKTVIYCNNISTKYSVFFWQICFSVIINENNISQNYNKQIFV